MAVATDREYGLFIGEAPIEPASGEVRDLVEPATGYRKSGFGREPGLETLDPCLETTSVIVSTGARLINPFGL